MLYGFRIIKQTLCENSVPSVRGFGAIQKTPPRQVGAAFIIMLYRIIQQPRVSLGYLGNDLPLDFHFSLSFFIFF